MHTPTTVEKDSKKLFPRLNTTIKHALLKEFLFF